jgi:hypothetical protein
VSFFISVFVANIAAESEIFSAPGATSTIFLGPHASSIEFIIRVDIRTCSVSIIADGALFVSGSRAHVSLAFQQIFDGPPIYFITDCSRI